jgi:hypothetical protein
VLGWFRAWLKRHSRLNLGGDLYRSHAFINDRWSCTWGCHWGDKNFPGGGKNLIFAQKTSKNIIFLAELGQEPPCPPPPIPRLRTHMSMEYVCRTCYKAIICTSLPKTLKFIYLQLFSVLCMVYGNFHNGYVNRAFKNSLT